MNYTTLELSGSPRGAEQLGTLGAALCALPRVVGAWMRVALAARQRDTELMEVVRVRALAQRHQLTDRGFSSDLLAAADRHEAALRSRRKGSAANRR